MSEPDLDMLTNYLRELRLISQAERDLETDRARINAQAIPLVRRLGTHAFLDPTDGLSKVASVRDPERLEVDAGQLLKALVEFYGDEEVADVIWRDCLKAPEVDTKDGGAFHVQCEAGKVPPEVVVKVARYKAISPSIGYAKLSG